MKSLRKIGFYSAFILPLLLVLGYLGGGFWMLSIHLFVFGMVPLMDYFFQKDQSNVPKSAISEVEKEKFYRLVTYVWVYVQLGVLIWAFYIVSQMDLGLMEWVLFTTGTALVTGGVGITVAHELGHKQNRLEQFYAKVLLMTVCYMHFFIEHNRGHHVRVATPDDPATSRVGENFYAFWWRSVTDGYKSALSLEKSRLRKIQIPFWSTQNQMIQFAFWPLCFVVCFTLVFSGFQNRLVLEIPIFFFAQSVLAFTLLELVNYLEHYGMERKRLATGKYERVTPLHSWNASHVVSNFLLFQLQRHSDHHAFAHKRYQVLDHHSDSPQLPAGYSAMIILAMFPPLWFSVMNPRLEEWKRLTSNLKT
ncbi:alkane 1-monooxygenase [Pararhodonellum marinum]|uniref:alkane 1-monooxygenase n=1 Tax=Pararhodonellum marinum TaxID=2755358 RepID=UPI00188F82F7|nr:alkane 1-monooxygenase [Pararhodonellum marinum]